MVFLLAFSSSYQEELCTISYGIVLHTYYFVVRTGVEKKDQIANIVTLLAVVNCRGDLCNTVHLNE